MQNDLDVACVATGRDPASIERTAAVMVDVAGVDGPSTAAWVTGLRARREPAVTGSTEELADFLFRLADDGIAHVQPGSNQTRLRESRPSPQYWTCWIAANGHHPFPAVTGACPEETQFHPGNPHSVESAPDLTLVSGSPPATREEWAADVHGGTDPAQYAYACTPRYRDHRRSVWQRKAGRRIHQRRARGLAAKGDPRRRDVHVNARLRRTATGGGGPGSWRTIPKVAICLPALGAATTVTTEIVRAMASWTSSSVHHQAGDALERG